MALLMSESLGLLTWGFVVGSVEALNAGAPAEYRWYFDLIDEDPRRRVSALARHRQLLEESVAPMRGGKYTRATAAERDQAAAACSAARRQTLFGPLDAFSHWGADLAARERYMPYALLFLQWEARYPEEWREAGTWTWSPWSVKETLLKQLIQHGVPPEYHGDVAVLVIAAVGRSYRCKDWMYAAVARHVADPALRDKLIAAAGTAESLASLRCRFLLHVLDAPGLAVRYQTWHRWLAQQPQR